MGHCGIWEQIAKNHKMVGATQKQRHLHFNKFSFENLILLFRRCRSKFHFKPILFLAEATKQCDQIMK